jgi:2-desacetyl-2-hydroxyethyl bacteriochlorophyllide A dehydrogenase
VTFASSKESAGKRISEAEGMQASVIYEPRHVRLEQVELKEPGPDEVLVRVEGCGVCGSNVPVWEGREWFTYPLEPGAPGHEAWGVVAATGSQVDGYRAGQRVAMLSQHGFAEYDTITQDMVAPLPAKLDGKPFPGEPLGCAVNIMRRSDIQPGQTVAIVGMGFLGAVLTRLASMSGARVIAIARKESALQTALQFGAAEVVKMDDHWRIMEQVKGLTDGRGCDQVIEAVGKQWPLDLAAELTSERGKLIIAGYHQDGTRQVNMQLWNWRGLDVINAHERDPKIYMRGIREAIDLVASGALDPTPLYTHLFSLEEAANALEATATRPEGFVKALVMVT